MHETFIYAQTTLPPFGLQDPKIAPNKPQGSVIQNTYQPPRCIFTKRAYLHHCATVQSTIYKWEDMVNGILHNQLKAE